MLDIIDFQKKVLVAVSCQHADLQRFNGKGFAKNIIWKAITA